MPLVGNQAASHFANYAERARALSASYSKASQSVGALLEAAETEVQSAALALSTAYLDQLSPDAIDYAQRLTGFRGFSRRSPFKALEREGQVLRQTIARTVADERYRRREFLVGPAGERTLKLQECQSLLEPWEAECAVFEQEPGFLELVDVGYDTVAFSEQFWEASYWKHWAAGDRICAALDKDDFGDDVLPAYRTVNAERTRWRAQVQQAEAAIDEIHDLVQQHDQAVARVPQLPEIYLKGSQDVLAEHLRHADAQLLDQWLPQSDDTRPQRLALRRFAGASAKLEFLTELKLKALEQPAANFKARSNKYVHKATKYNRPKRYSIMVGDADLDLGFKDKVPRYEQRLAKLQALAQRIGSFDRYDDFDLSNAPELWWLHITGKRPPSQLSTTRRWYDNHPDAAARRDQTDAMPAAAQAVAQAAASRQLDDADYLS